MKNFENREAAFASQNYDPNAVEMKGVPPHIVEAAKAFVNRCVVTDAVNEGFHPNYEDYSEEKWESFYDMGSPSGAGFSLFAHDVGRARSIVGARLVSESREAAAHVDELAQEDIKTMMVYDRSEYETSKGK